MKNQIGKRIFLFLVVNILIVTTISIILSLFHVQERIGGDRFTGLMVFCLIWGMGGAFISLAISKWMAKWMMGVEVIDPDTSDPRLRQLVETVHNLARSAGLPKMPEVGIYNSPEINAFATGPSKSSSLVAVSSGLLQNMRTPEVEGVLGHEIAHVANGDMVTMTLVQGVINAFVMFLARVLAFALTQGRDRDENRGGGMAYFLLVMVFQIVFSILGSMVVCWFSRWREFRADAGGAQFAGRERMIAALRALKVVHEHGADQVGEPQTAFQSLKISGKTHSLAMLFSTHPPLEERIARLENPMNY